MFVILITFHLMRIVLLLIATKNNSFRLVPFSTPGKYSKQWLQEGFIRVCGDAFFRYFWCGFAVIFILTHSITVSKH